MTQDEMLLEMERRYGCRYETGRTPSGFTTSFPVTHVIIDHALPQMRYVHVSINNTSLVTWRIYNEHGKIVLHGEERNYSRDRTGYVRMLRGALWHVRQYGARRVYPRNPAHRAQAARKPEHWQRNICA